MLHRLRFIAPAACLFLALAGPARATILTFEVFDPNLDFPPFNDPTVQPFLAGYGYPEGFRIPGDYGDNVNALQTPAAPGPNDVIYRYGVGAEGFTPMVTASYGPFSIFTGGPELWREGYGDLNGVLYQGSRHSDPGNPIGTDYNILDVVLVADSGFDVVLYGFDVAAFGTDRTINAVTVYNGVPFPFLTPFNDIFEDLNVVVPGGNTHLTYDFESLLGNPLQAHVIWLRIDANNLGPDSENIGIDNIRFGQVASQNTEVVDPDAVFRDLEAVPEPASLVMCLLGGCFGAAGYLRRRWLSA